MIWYKQLLCLGLVFCAVYGIEYFLLQILIDGNYEVYSPEVVVEILLKLVLFPLILSSKFGIMHFLVSAFVFMILFMFAFEMYKRFL